MHVVMVAAENGAMAGGKVGGMGDVLRDVPRALAGLKHRVTVITPGYKSLIHSNPCTLLMRLQVPFAGRTESVEVFRGKADAGGNLISHYFVEHPLFSACGAGKIYCNDGYGPFATDAYKFALFCAAVGEFLIREDGLPRKPDVIHIHDWHAALLAVLRRFHPGYQALQKFRLVYTIHNLSLQGVRPFADDDSSLFSWFPGLAVDMDLIRDPRYGNCVNLMRCGLNLSDVVHAVSPGYAQEIVQPSDPEHGFFGGEGLEQDLQRLQTGGQLKGILNGCEYGSEKLPRTRWQDLLRLTAESLDSWAAGQQWLPASLYHARHRVSEWQRSRKARCLRLVSITRLTDQKVSLLRQPVTCDGRSEPALDVLLRQLGDDLYIMVGNGDPAHEAFFARAMSEHSNFLFLQGFSEALADALYRAGDLFMMPSSFEPCGISQLLAMRGGTPCIVHHVGGLRDTVVSGVNGFAFSGDSPGLQARAMLDVTRRACELAASDSKAWQQLQEAAQNTRFDWDKSIHEYLRLLYRPQRQ